MNSVRGAARRIKSEGSDASTWFGDAARDTQKSMHQYPAATRNGNEVRDETRTATQVRTHHLKERSSVGEYWDFNIVHGPNMVTSRGRKAKWITKHAVDI